MCLARDHAKRLKPSPGIGHQLPRRAPSPLNDIVGEERGPVPNEPPNVGPFPKRRREDRG